MKKQTMRTGILSKLLKQAKERCYFQGNVSEILSDKFKWFFNNLPGGFDIKIISQYEEFDDSILKIFALEKSITVGKDIDDEVVIVDDNVFVSGKEVKKDAKKTIDNFLKIWGASK